MNTLSELKTKILKSSHINKIECLISLRAFLVSQENTPWVILTDLTQIDTALNNFNNQDLKDFINKNIKNIKKIGFNITIFELMPKNKRLILVHFLNEIIENLIEEKFIIKDPIRSDPFKKDSLFETIIENKQYISNENFELYKKRNENLLKFKNEIVYKKNNFDLCSDLSYKNKIKITWIKTWGDKKNYCLSSDSSIENIIL